MNQRSKPAAEPVPEIAVYPNGAVKWRTCDRSGAVVKETDFGPP